MKQKDKKHFESAQGQDLFALGLLPHGETFLDIGSGGPLICNNTYILEKNQWKNKLTKEQKHFLSNIFRFFTQGDVDVAGGYVKNYLPTENGDPPLGNADKWAWDAENKKVVSNKLINNKNLFMNELGFIRSL